MAVTNYDLKFWPPYHVEIWAYTPDIISMPFCVNPVCSLGQLETFYKLLMLRDDDVVCCRQTAHPYKITSKGCLAVVAHIFF